MAEFKKVVLEEKADTTKKFFVRFQGAVADWKEKLEATFGAIEIVTLEGNVTEFAFVTEVMSEKEFASRVEQLPEMITRIRVEF